MHDSESEMVFRKCMHHKGIILLRTFLDSIPIKIKIIERLLKEKYTLENNFVVASEATTRIIPTLQ